jgi:hypothetical protein
MFTKQTDPPVDLSNVRTEPAISQKDATTDATETSGEQTIQAQVTPQVPQQEVVKTEKKVIESRFSSVNNKMSTFST